MSASGWGTRHRRLILGVGLGIIAAWYAVLLVSYVLVPKLENAVRTRVEKVLSAQFASDVRFQSFDVTFVPRVHVVARGVLIGNTSAHPLLSATTADAQSDLLLPWHVGTLVLEGLSLRIPTTNGPANPSAAATKSKPQSTISIDEIVSEHAHVELLPSGDQAPLKFELVHLRVKNFDTSHAADFSALVAVPEPRADIQANGRMGPWNARNPSCTSLQGTYNVPHCDLATLPGLKGILSSQGRFQGVLQQIEIAGDADAPQFSLSGSGHAEPLHVSFQAAVDAFFATGSIEKLNGVLGSSSFAGSGLVRNIQDDRIRDIALDASVNKGRLQDVVPLAVKSAISPISGSLRVRAKLDILPGEQDILSRLRMDGDFAASDARFSSLDLREELRNLSRKAVGHPKDAAAGSSISSIQGHVRLNNGVADFSNLVFDLEGASAQLNGSYQLASDRLDFHGELSMDAKLSQTATGAKAFFLKAADPFFRGKRGGSQVPIKITGTRSDPQFGVDLAK
jgi:hypothetical protein